MLTVSCVFWDPQISEFIVLPSFDGLQKHQMSYHLKTDVTTDGLRPCSIKLKKYSLVRAAWRGRHAVEMINVYGLQTTKYPVIGVIM